MKWGPVAAQPMKVRHVRGYEILRSVPIWKHRHKMILCNEGEYHKCGRMTYVRDDTDDVMMGGLRAC